MRPFEHVRCESAAEAVRAWHDAGNEAAYYAGGTELLLLMKQGLSRCERLVDIKHIAALGEIASTQQGVVRIGAAVTHRRLELSPELQRLAPLISRVERDVANVRVRNVGTIGGNLCFAEPHSDIGVLSLLLEATMTIQGLDQVRRVPAWEFFRGPYESAVEQGELLLHIEFPACREGTRTGYQRFRHHERPSCIAGVLLEPGEDPGNCGRAVVAIGAAGYVPQRSRSAEAALSGRTWREVAAGAAEAAALTAAESDPTEDLTGSVEYKRHLVEVLTRRAVLEAVGRMEEGQA